MLVGRTDTPLGSFYRRKRAHLGAPKAITATARKLGCLIYRLIKDGQTYQEPDLHTYELKYKNQILRSLRRRANGFGFDLVELLVRKGTPETPTDIVNRLNEISFNATIISEMRAIAFVQEEDHLKNSVAYGLLRGLKSPFSRFDHPKAQKQ